MAGGTRFPWGRYLLCGALIGAGAILPGISGGALAVAFGIYRPFMDILARPRETLPRYWRMIPPLALGWTLGFFLIARGLSAAMTRSESVCLWLFMGLIAGSVPALYREAGREGRPASAWVCATLCAAALFASLYCVRHVLRVQLAPDLRGYAFCGALCGAGAVLPGFSAAPIMMALGLYQPLLDDFTALRWPTLAACLTGFVLAAASLARLMSRLFRRRYALVAHGVLGIVCASALSMTPLRYRDAWEAAASAIACGAGYLLARRMGRMENALSDESGGV